MLPTGGDRLIGFSGVANELAYSSCRRFWGDHARDWVRGRDRIPRLRPRQLAVGSGHLHDNGSEISDEAPFLAENEAAMKKMMSDMAVKPTGDVDADFVAMMVPHHQGAIDMALAVLRYGRNPQIRRLAQEIIVTQQQEIAAMRLAVGQPLPPAVPSPTGGAARGADRFEIQPSR